MPIVAVTPYHRRGAGVIVVCAGARAYRHHVGSLTLWHAQLGALPGFEHAAQDAGELGHRMNQLQAYSRLACARYWQFDQRGGLGGAVGRLARVQAGRRGGEGGWRADGQGGRAGRAGGRLGRRGWRGGRRASRQAGAADSNQLERFAGYPCEVLLGPARKLCPWIRLGWRRSIPSGPQTSSCAHARCMCAPPLLPRHAQGAGRWVPCCLAPASEGQRLLGIELAGIDLP